MGKNATGEATRQNEGAWVAEGNSYEKIKGERMTMWGKSVLFMLLLVAITQFPFSGSAQDTVPRNGDEALALRILSSYRESQTRLAQLEADRIKVKGFISEVAPGSTMVGTAVAPEDSAQLKEINEEIAKQQGWCRQLEAFWEKNRAVPPASALSFAGRYGPLSSSGERSTDPKYNKIEYAIRNFPFNAEQFVGTHPRVGGIWKELTGGCAGAKLTFAQAPDGTVTAVTNNAVPCKAVWVGSNIRWTSTNVLELKYDFTRAPPGWVGGRESIAFADDGRTATGTWYAGGTSGTVQIGR